MRGVGHQKRSKLVRFVTSHPCRASGSPRRPDAPRTERTRSPHHPPRPAARARADARRRRGRIAPHRRGQGQFRVGLLPRSFRTRRAHSLSRLGRKSKPLLTVQQLRAPRGVMHTGGARPAGASVVRTSSRAAEMQKKVRAQRALLGDGSGGPGATAGDPAGCRSAMALGHGFPAGRDPGGLLSPVSSIGVKLDSLYHWNGTPGAPAGHPAAIDGARVPNSAMIERARLAEPSSMSLSFSPGTAEQAHELRPSGYYPPTTVAPGSRGNVERDLEPVRSNDGMSFADMLARNGGANPSRTQPPSRVCKRGAERLVPVHHVCVQIRSTFSGTASLVNKDSSTGSGRCTSLSRSRCPPRRSARSYRRLPALPLLLAGQAMTESDTNTRRRTAHPAQSTQLG